MRKLLLALGVTLMAPVAASAHEVYVLSKETVSYAMQMPALPIWDIGMQDLGKLFFWAFITFWAVLTILAISVSKKLERFFDPLLHKLKRYAPLVARITLGLAMMASAVEAAAFGPELAFSGFLSPGLIFPLQIGLFILGLLVFIGLFTRLASVALMLFYLWMWTHYGVYMLTYTNYFGEMIITLIAGNAVMASDRYLHHLYPHALHNMVRWIEGHAFLILRAAFGISLIFASFYAKFLHAELALQTVGQYGLTAYLPFDPPFLVLGAFAIELLLGCFFLFGIEIRFASIFLLFWLTLSLLYFQESVWPHIVLAGTAIAIFMRGYDKYTLEWGLMRAMNKRAREPVL